MLQPNLLQFDIGESVQETTKSSEKSVQSHQSIEPMVLSVKEMAKVLGVGMNTAYELTNVKGFPVVKIGGRKLIPVKLLREWVNGNSGRAFL